MQLQRILSLRQIFGIIGITLLLLVSGSTILLLPITETGHFSSQIYLDTPCHFTDLNFSLDDSHNLSFPDGGHLVSIFKDKKPIAVAIYGNGYVDTQNRRIETKECFLILPSNMYYTLMSQLYLQTSEESVYAAKAKYSLPNLLKIMPFIVTPAGNKYFSLPDSYSSIMLLDSNGTNPTTITVGNQSPIRSASFLLTSVGYIMLYLTVLGFILLLTNRRQDAGDSEKLFVFRPSPRFFRLYLLILIASWLGLSYLSKNAYLNGAFLVIALCSSIYYLTVRKAIYAGYLRVKLDNYLKYLPLSLILGIILFILGAMSIPNFFKPLHLWLSDTLCLVWAPTLWICFLVFGYFFYELERYYSTKKSWIIVFAFVIIAVCGLLLYIGAPLHITLLNSLIFVPLYFLIISVLVLRTNNVFIASTAVIVSLTLAKAFIS